MLRIVPLPASSADTQIEGPTGLHSSVASLEGREQSAPPRVKSVGPFWMTYHACHGAQLSELIRHLF